MSIIKVDARGMGCPKPVIATKQALDSLTEGQVTTLVDNAVSKENVVKFASNQGYGVMVEETDMVGSAAKAPDYRFLLFSSPDFVNGLG